MSNQVPFIGREAELERIETIIAQSRGTHLICIHGRGGIGKSRLLRQIRKARPCPPLAPLLDFDDLSVSTPENVRHKLARGCGPHAFDSYFRRERDFRKIQDSQVSAAALREFRHKVDDDFVACFNALSAKQRMVLFLDTTDHLRAEHGVTKNLMAILPRLENSVILLAGRNGRALYEMFVPLTLPRGDVRLIELRPFSESESRDYLRCKAEMRHLRLEADLTEKLIVLAEGKPILLDLAVDWRARGISLDWVTEMDISHLQQLDGPEKSARLTEFQQHLVAHVKDLQAPMNELILMLAHLYPVEAKMLGPLENEDIDARTLFENAKGYSFVKTLPDGAISLHDVMREMVNTHVWPRIPAKSDRRVHYSRSALTDLKTEIKDGQETLTELKAQAEQDRKDTDPAMPPFVQAEGLRRRLWVLREQLLKHTLIVDVDKGLALLEQLCEAAAADGQIMLRPRLIQLAAQKKDSFSDGQSALLDYYRADQLFYEAAYDAARTRIESVLQRHELSPEMTIRAIKLRGNIRIRQGEVAQAISDFTETVRLSEEHNETVHLVMALNALGWAYRLKFDLDQALDHYQAARKRYRQVDQQKRDRLQKDYGLILNNMAVLLSENSRTREAAIGMAGRAVKYWHKLDHQVYLGTGYRVQGICFYRTGHTEQALGAFEKALNIFEPLGLKSWIASTCSFRGALYHSMGNSRKAEEDLTRSLAIGPGHLRPMTLSRLGRVCMQLKKWKAARRHLDASLAEAQKLPDHKYWLGAMARLIVLAAQTGQSRRLDYFQARLAGCLERIPKPDRNELGIAYLGLAHLALLQNSWDQMALIVEYLKKGIPDIVLHGAWARTDIVRRLEYVAEDFYLIDPAIVREVGARMIAFIESEEEEDPSFSSVLEIMHEWTQWKGTSE